MSCITIIKKIASYNQGCAQKRQGARQLLNSALLHIQGRNCPLPILNVKKYERLLGFEMVSSLPPKQKIFAQCLAEIGKKSLCQAAP